MCQPRGGQGFAGISFPPGACCCGCGLVSRRFFSSQEELEHLEAYAEQLKKELAGVEERLREVRGK